jgi:peptidoglycan/LPS O-acetylase OafA/YrhL
MTIAGHLAAVRKLLDNSVIATDYLTAVGFAGFMFVLLHDTSSADDFLYRRISRRLSGFSYSLYLTHLPFLVFLRAWLIPGRPWTPSLLTVAYAATLTAACIVFATLFAAATEQHTAIVRRQLDGIIMRFRRAAAQLRPARQS